MIAIQFDNVGKLYRLGTVGTGTLSHDLNRWWKTRVLHQEDPYLKIGETNDRATHGHSDYVWALKDISFNVEQGDVVGIIGKNGAGKSTLLKLLSQITSPTTGVIRARGRIGSLLEVGTGFHPEMTGRENIYMNGSIMGMTRHEITRKLDEIIDFAGVARYIDTPVKRYSSGMTVRLGFAVAAFMEPEILVVDEVLAVGDAEFQKKAIGKMQDISYGSGRTVLFVSHNMTSIKRFCNKGILLRNAQLYHEGNVDEVVNKYLEDLIDTERENIREIKTRAGNGTLRFIGLRITDKVGKERNDFAVGETVRIEVSFMQTNEFKQSMRSQIDLAVNDAMNVRVTWLSTSVYYDKISNDKSTVVFEIPELLLAEGSYNFNLFSRTETGIADWVQNVGNLKVYFQDFFHTGRKILEKQGTQITKYIMV